MIEITLIPIECVAELWHVVGPMLQRAVDHTGGRFSVEDVLHDLIDGEQTLWLALDEGVVVGCATIRIVEYPTGLTSIVYEYLAGENVKAWMYQAHETMLRYAKEYGATRIEIPLGRKGWMPIMKELGFTVQTMRYETDIKGE